MVISVFKSLSEAHTHQLQQACVNNKRTTRIFAQDISFTSGAKCFIVGTLQDIFGTLVELPDSTNPTFQGRHMYELIPENWHCKLYLDIEYDTEHNKQVDRNKLIQVLKRAMVKFIESDGFSDQSFEIIFGDEPDIDILVLDSSNEKKVSYHMIIDIHLNENGQKSSILFKNNYHVGDFVSNFLVYCSQTPEYHGLFVCDPTYPNKNKLRFVCDMAVYNKNRCFRTIYSRKKKKNASTLMPVNTKHSEITFENFLKYLIICKYPKFHNVP